MELSIADILRAWAKAYRDHPEHRFPLDPDAEFFPADLEFAASELDRLALFDMSHPVQLDHEALEKNRLAIEENRRVRATLSNGERA